MFFRRSDMQTRFSEAAKRVKGDEVVKVTSRVKDHPTLVLMEEQRFDVLLKAEKKLELIEQDFVQLKNETKPGQNIINRLKFAIDRLRNGCRTSNYKGGVYNLSNEGIAQTLGLESVIDVDRWISGDLYPANSQLEKFSQIYGYSEEWVLTGFGEPFRTAGSNHYSKMIELMDKHNYSYLHLLWFSSDDDLNKEQIVVFIGDGEMNWMVLRPDRWFFDPGSGNAYANQKQFFSLIDEAKKRCFNVGSRKLGSDDYQKLYSFEEHPCYYLEAGKYSDWAYQLHDYVIDPKGWSHFNLKAAYGTDFFNTLEHLRKVFDGKIKSKWSFNNSSLANEASNASNAD